MLEGSYFVQGVDRIIECASAIEYRPLGVCDRVDATMKNTYQKVHIYQVYMYVSFTVRVQ